MVYETKTFVLCHELNLLGKKNYEALLEQEADEILFRHLHPIKWLISKIVELARA